MHAIHDRHELNHAKKTLFVLQMFLLIFFQTLIQCLLQWFVDCELN